MRCAILGNGASLNDHDLGRIALPVIGLNRSWRVVPDPDFHLCLEVQHYTDNPEPFDRLASAGKLYVGPGWPVGKPIKLVHEGIADQVLFSKDESEGAVSGLRNVGSVLYVGLQFAYWRGYRVVYALGLDLMGSHFDGTAASPNVAAQNSLLQFVPPAMSVYVCGSPDSLANFPKVPFDVITRPHD